MRFARIAAVLTAAVFLLSPVLAHADPCLIVYPAGACAYHYESAEYYAVGPGDPLYDAAYDRGGLVLREVGTHEIPLDIYQAPNILAFVLDEVNQGFFTYDTSFPLIVDGFHSEAITYTDIILVFDRFEPSFCLPFLAVNGMAAMWDPGCGWHCPIGDLIVTTPTPDGGHCSDVMTCAVQAVGCAGVRVWAFADENHNMVHDGGECFSAFSHDSAVPIPYTSWGRIKIRH